MSEVEFWRFCEKIANGEVEYIPRTLRAAIALRYESGGGRLRCRCDSSIKDAAIELFVKYKRGNGTESEDVPGAGTADD